MARKSAKDTQEFDQGLSAEQAGNGSWLWIWNGPGGQEYRGTASSDTEYAALKVGQKWLDDHRQS